MTNMMSNILPFSRLLLPTRQASIVFPRWTIIQKDRRLYTWLQARTDDVCSEINVELQIS